MKIKNYNTLPLMQANEIIVSNSELKSSLPKTLIVVHSAQKNYKTLFKHHNEYQADLENLRKEAAKKDEDGKPIIIPDPTRKGMNVYDIPADKMEEFAQAVKLIDEKEIDIELVVFSENSLEVIIKYLDGRQSDVMLDFLMERPAEKMAIAKDEKK
jgi:hypothetical protein